MSLSPSSNYTGASYLTNVKENWIAQLFNQDSYLNFDGTDDHIDLGATTSSSPMSLTSSTKASFAFWVKFSTLGNQEYIYSNNSVSNFAGISIHKNSSNQIAISWGDNSGGAITDYEEMKGNTALSADTWYFVAITTDFSLTTTNTVIKINNSAETVSNIGTSGGTTPTYTSGNAYIGRRHSTYGEFSIKNFAVFTGELNATNLTAIYNSGNFLSLEEDSGNYSTSSNLKGYFEFNNGENFAQDLSGNVNTGTISGAKYAGFLPIAMRDTKIDDIFYYGAIKSPPSIRQSIDLYKSKSKTSNTSLSIVNFKYQGSDISAELFLGSNSYYNRTVKVYSQLNKTSDITDCLQLYHGRLSSIAHNNDSVRLSLVTKKPWDNKFVPDVKSTTGRFFPLVYGAYTPNSSDFGSEAYGTAMNKLVFPVEVDAWSYYYYTLLHKNIGSTDTTLHYYEESLDAFLPLDNTNDAEEYGSGYSGITNWTLKRHFYFKPIATVLRSGTWSNTLNLFDGTAHQTSSSTPSTFAQFVYDDATAATTSPSTVHTHRSDVQFGITSFDDPFDSVSSSETNGLTCEIRWTMTGFYADSDATYSSPTTTDLLANSFAIYDNGAQGGNVNKVGADSIADGTIFSTNGSFSNVNAQSSGTAVTITEQTSSLNFLPSLTANNYDDFWIRFKRSASRVNDLGGGNEVGIFGTLKVYDIRFKTTLRIRNWSQNQTITISGTDTDTSTSNSRIKSVEKLYCGADGLTNSWDNSAITLGHEAHRDLLIRYAGMPTVEPQNYSTLANDRAGWLIRYWQHKESSLANLLEKIQYEFGFIHIIDGAGNSKYVWVHGTDSDNVFRAQDVAVTLEKSDISKLEITTTSVRDVITKSKIGTVKHPAKKHYITETTVTNSTPRAKYNVKSKEDISTINLDALTLAPATDPSSTANKQADFSSYYYQINGDVKKIINCEIVNFAKGYILEVGDVVKFDNMHINPYADNWNDYYIITSLTRSLNKVSIKLLEVG